MVPLWVTEYPTVLRKAIVIYKMTPEIFRVSLFPGRPEKGII